MRKLLLLVAVFVLFSACSPRRSGYVQISGFAQGGTYTVKINVKGVGVPVAEIKDSIGSILKQIDSTLSGYNRKSMLSRFNVGEKVRPNGMFLDMYRMGYTLWERSEGAVDCAAAPLFDAWGFGFKNSDFPSDSAVSALVSGCGMKLLPPSLPVEDGTVDPSVLGFPSLNFNAVAQGYSCDAVARYLYSIGVKDMLVDIGEIWCDGLSPSGKPWSVGIDRPSDDNAHGDPSALEGVWSSGGSAAGVVTSGNYRKFYIRDGKKFAHTVDPRTGYPVTHNLMSATVVSPRGAAEADAVATWCMVVGLDKAKEIILGDDALEAFLVFSADDGSMQEWVSPGFTLRN